MLDTRRVPPCPGRGARSFHLRMTLIFTGSGAPVFHLRLDLFFAGSLCYTETMFTMKPERYDLTMCKGTETRVWTNLTYPTLASFTTHKQQKGWVVLSVLVHKD